MIDSQDFIYINLAMMEIYDSGENENPCCYEIFHETFKRLFSMIFDRLEEEIAVENSEFKISSEIRS